MKVYNATVLGLFIFTVFSCVSEASPQEHPPTVLSKSTSVLESNPKTHYRAKIAFVSNRDGKPGIYTMNTDGSNITQLTDGKFDLMPSWSPDGKKLAFMTFKKEDYEIAEKYHLGMHFMLYIMDVDGTNHYRAVSVPVEPLYVWSPDGKKIATISAYEDSSHFGKDGLNSSTIYVSDLDGKEPRKLTAVLGMAGSPVWSPNGRQIAYDSAPVAGKTSDIFVMNEDGSEKRRVAQGKYPQWSPDGRKIAFMSDKGVEEQLPSQSNIYIVDVNGKNQRKLTNSETYKRPLSWSPDGSKILFSSGEDICIMDSNGGNQINLTNHPARDFGGIFSPDGKQVLFRSNRDGNWEIYTVGIDGNGLNNLTNNPANDMFPSWSPLRKFK